MKYFDNKEYKFNESSSDGVYIIHGFTNTTYETKELAKYLAEQGYYTHAINLPGHGTTPEDCNNVKYSDWIEYTEKGIAEMSSKCDNVFVIGVSMGSDLALHLSSTFPLNGAVFASTVLEFKDFIGPRILTPLLHKFVPFRRKELIYEKNIRKDLNYFGYEVWPMSAVNEMRKLTNLVKKELNNVKCPALIAHSKIDKLSPQSNIDIVYNNISSNHKEKLIVDNAKHNLFLESLDQQMIFKTIASFFNQFREINN